MIRSTSRLASILFLSLAACASVTDDESTATSDTPAAEQPATDPATDPASGVAFRFFTADPAGTPANAFGSLDEAHLTSAGTMNVAPGDYFFSVSYEVCPQGLPQDQYFPQQSPIACRSFTVGANGRIVAGAAVADVDDVACPHLATATPNGIAIGLAPFELHRDACGVFLVRVIPAGLAETNLAAVANLFFTAPVESPDPAPMCGDGHVDAGEQCDDGNENDHDGCSASCHIETEDC